MIPIVYFSESNTGLVVEEEWTPVVSDTPTQTLAPSITFTLHDRPTFTVSPSPSVSTNCVYPLEYWGEHPESWLDMLVGNTIYSKDDIRLIIDDPSQEIHQILLEQLYLSNLNIYSGADPEVIKDVLGGANQWLQKYLHEQPSEDAQLVGIQLAQTLTDFNTGLIGPGFCSPYDTLTVTPVVIDPTATLAVIEPNATPSPTATSTATRVFVTLKPTATATKTKKPEKPEPTDPPRPTQEPDPPAPTQNPKPTEAPTSAPPDDTPKPTTPPQPTEPGDKPTPTPAS